MTDVHSFFLRMEDAFTYSGPFNSTRRVVIGSSREMEDGVGIRDVSRSFSLNSLSHALHFCVGTHESGILFYLVKTS